jgi:hypothetical protein
MGVEIFDEIPHVTAAASTVSGMNGLSLMMLAWEYLA